MNVKPALILEGASKTYSIAKKEVNALMNVTLEVPPGRCCMLVGPSGSGKTTLLNLAALLTRPSAGRVVLFGKDTNSLGEYGLDRLRRQFIGVVFQAFNLLGGLNVLDNVTLPLVPRGMGPKKRKEAGMATLERLGLGGFAALRAEQLSGGEQQRVAIARALVGDPSLMIADEPTSNLDEENVLAILEILAKLKEEGKTLLLSSHDARVLEGGLADTVVRLKNGALQGLAAKG
ncbi:MAG: ABC transporter ATP-binding protein [Nitrospirota bacterium]|nr:ABC transporter ATP-binding protein [Nitrospirota bacterium]